MNPTLSALIKEKQWILLLVAGLFMVLVIIIALRASHPQHVMSATPFRDTDNFSHLNGKDIYNYNGLAFYKLNLDNDTVTTLQAGTKLPLPDRVYWANDNGALMSFTGSFIATAVEDKLRADGLIVNEVTQSYVWYFDFADESLHLVSRTPVLDRSVWYSERDNGFYYGPDLSLVEGELSGPRTDIHFYDIESKKDNRLSTSIAATDIQGVTGCDHEMYRLCFIARDTGELTLTKLFALKRDNTIQTPLETKGRIISTNNPDLFITTAKADESSQARSARETVDIEPTNAEFYNLKDGSTKGMGLGIGGEMILAYVHQANDYYFLSDKTILPETEATYHSVAPNLIGFADHKDIPLQYSDNTAFTGGLIAQVSYGDDGRMLVADSNGEVLLFEPQQQAQPITKMSVDESATAIDECGQGRVRDLDYYSDPSQYRLFFADNNRFDQAIKTFGTCMATTSAQSFVGYNFYLGGLSPVNGRITTD